MDVVDFESALPIPGMWANAGFEQELDSSECRRDVGVLSIEPPLPALPRRPAHQIVGGHRTTAPRARVVLKEDAKVDPAVVRTAPDAEGQSVGADRGYGQGRNEVPMDTGCSSGPVVFPELVGQDQVTAAARGQGDA